MAVASLDLDLEVFQGPFDLLLTLVLKEEVDLLEVDLAEVVLAYVEHLERAGELDLEAATEFLVLIAALLELKSRLMLPREDEEELDLDRGEAADELLARMLEYTRYRGAATYLRERLEAESGFRYRSAPLPPELRRVSVELAEKSYDPVLLAEAIGGLLHLPEPISLRHVAKVQVSVSSSAWRTCAICSRAAGASASTTPWRASIGSPRRSRCSRCLSSTRRARRPGSRGDVRRDHDFESTVHGPQSTGGRSS